MRYRATILALALVLGACGGDSAADTATSAPETTTTEATTTTTESTTTTTAPTTTTTTVPTRTVIVDVGVYDDLPSGPLEEGAPCDVSTGEFAFMSANTGVVLEDPNTQETLAVTRVDSGQLALEAGLPADLPPDVEDLFWYCSFVGQFEDVPVDRDFYEVTVDGDTIISDGLTFDGDEVRETLYIPIGYFYTDNEAIRSSYRKQ